MNDFYSLANLEAAMEALEAAEANLARVSEHRPKNLKLTRQGWYTGAGDRLRKCMNSEKVALATWIRAVENEVLPQGSDNTSDLTAMPTEAVEQATPDESHIDGPAE